MDSVCCMRLVAMASTHTHTHLAHLENLESYVCVCLCVYTHTCVCVCVCVCVHRDLVLLHREKRQHDVSLHLSGLRLLEAQPLLKAYKLLLKARVRYVFVFFSVQNCRIIRQFRTTFTNTQPGRTGSLISPVCSL